MHHEMFKMFVGDELAKEIFSCWIFTAKKKIIEWKMMSDWTDWWAVDKTVKLRKLWSVSWLIKG
jgi:hypothetical protein